MDKQIRNLIILSFIVFVLMIASSYFLYKPKVLGSPAEKIILQNNAYFISAVFILGFLFIFLIALIVGRYAIIRARERKSKEEDL